MSFLARRLVFVWLGISAVGCGKNVAPDPSAQSKEQPIAERGITEENFKSEQSPPVRDANQSFITDAEHRANAQLKAEEAAAEQRKFYGLGRSAKEMFAAGKTNEARASAEELLQLLQVPRFRNNWNYGNAVQDANLVLGRIAVQEGRIDDAKSYLKNASQSRGSPQMNSFGPNMSLAKDLLEKGERDAVLEHFEACRKFWEMEGGRLDQWSQEIRAGGIPNFGANLLY